MALSLLLVGNAAMAQEVSEDEARNRALQFLSTQTDGPRRAKGLNVSTDLSLAYTSRSEAKTCFYVFNVGEGEGFVIAGGDQAARPILYYCDHGTFDLDNAAPGFRFLLDQYTEQIAHPEEKTEAIASSARHAKTAETREYIAPMIQTKWHQYYPYNCEIPIYDSEGRRYYTGCVATAMAMIMNYYRWPADNGVGSHSYLYIGNEFSADFANTIYDWENMALSYGRDDTYTDEQAKAVGTLMYHAGVSVNMNYGVGESNAFNYMVPSALAKYFKYDKSVTLDWASHYSIDEWEELLYNELKEGRPVFYTAAQHAFVCDGYDNENNLFSFNWGYGGRDDGFGSITGKYMRKGQIVRNIMPDQGGKESINLNGSSLVLLRNSKKCNENANLKYNLLDTQDNWEVRCSLVNYSCISKTFDFGVEAKEVTSGKTYLDYSGTYTLKENYGPNNSLCLSFNPYEIKEEGTYELRPVVKLESDEEWTDIDISSSVTVPTLTVDIEPTDIVYETNEANVPVLHTLPVEHTSYYKGNTTYTTSDPNVATVDENGLITGVAEGAVTITAHGDGDEFFNETTTEIEITVTPFEKFKYGFAEPDNSLLIGETLTINFNQQFEGDVVFSTSDPSIATIDEHGVISGISPGSCSITAHGSENDYYTEGKRSFKLSVYSKSVQFRSQPYFEYDNNVANGYTPLIFEMENTGTSASGYAIYYTVSDTNLSGKYSGYEVPAGELDVLYLSDPFIQNWEEAGQLQANKTYTMYLYKDRNHTIPYNYPSITFTYRDPLFVDYGVSPSGYGTLILPFNAELPEGMTVYTCPEVDANGVLTLVEDYGIERNVPYIVKATYGEIYNFVGPEAIVADKPSFQKGILVGAVTPNVPLQIGTDYILQVQNDKAAFYRYDGSPADDIELNNADGYRLAAQFRAFLRLESAQNAKLFLPGMMDEETEGIATLRADGSTPAGIYTIDGHRYDELQKGLNILILGDGTAQKVFVK